MTGFRFLLALWVILHHLIGSNMMLEQWSKQQPAAIRSILESGFLAVQTFFVLSGFVLARTYASSKWKRNDLIRFGMARFARVYPVFAMSMLIMIPFIVETLAKPGRNGIQKVELLGQYSFLLIGWLTPRGVGWNTPAWSLTCEFFFYLWFPLLFLWLRKGTMPRLIAALAISFTLPIALAHAGVPGAWKPIHHLSDFIAGIATAKLFEKIEAAKWKQGYWLYVPALAAAFLFITQQQILTGTYADLNTAMRPVNVVLLLGFAINGGRLLSSHIARYLGEASYSMYILHVPLLWWFSRFGLQTITGAAPIYLAFVILGSIAAFELVEKPANRWLRNWTNEQLVTSATRTFAPLRPHFDTPAAPYPHASVPAASESAY